jgi:hypothetical protein
MWAGIDLSVPNSNHSNQYNLNIDDTSLNLDILVNNESWQNKSLLEKINKLKEYDFITEAEYKELMSVYNFSKLDV